MMCIVIETTYSTLRQNVWYLLDQVKWIGALNSIRSLWKLVWIIIIIIVLQLPYIWQFTKHLAVCGRNSWHFKTELYFLVFDLCPFKSPSLNEWHACLLDSVFFKYNQRASNIYTFRIIIVLSLPNYCVFVCKRVSFTSWNTE